MPPATDPYGRFEKGMQFFREAEAAGSLGYGKAIKEFTKAIELRPLQGKKYAASHGIIYDPAGISEWLMARALAWKRTNQTWGEIEDYKDAIFWDPDNAEAYYNRGIGRQKLGIYSGAREDFVEACRLSYRYC